MDIFDAIKPKVLRPAFAVTPYSPGTFDPTSVPFTNLGSLIASLLQVVFFGAGLLAFAFLILGGIEYITSGGEKDKVQGAQQKLTYAILGLVLVVAIYAIVRIIETVLGIPILKGFTFKGPGGGGWIGPPGPPGGM